MSFEKGSPTTSPPPILIVPSTGDLPVEGNVCQLVTESPNSFRDRKRIIVLSIAAVVLVLLATIIGLSVALTRKNSNGNSMQLNSGDNSLESSSCPEVPNGGCSVCGQDSCVHKPEEVFSYPGQPSVSCSALQSAGYRGMISSDQCWILQDLIRSVCDCHSSSNTNKPSLITPEELERRTSEYIDWITKNGYSSSESLQDSTSPQRLAVEFMIQSTIVLSELPTTETSLDDINLWKERYALAVFYFSLNGPTWLNPSSFLNPSAPNCNWNSPVVFIDGIDYEGARCADSTFVTHISFFGNNLIGSIPSELALFQDLTSILIVNEDLTGPLPESLQNLSKMRILSLNNSSLTGSFPSWIGAWSNLGLASFSSNMLTGSIPSSISSLTDLILFAVDDNLMTGNLDPLQRLSNLNSIFLDDNSFQDVLDDSFFKKHSSLIALDMSTNELKGKVPTRLMGTSLQILDLHSNLLTELPDTIPRNSSLVFLALYDNPITGAFPNKTSSHWKELRHLDISATSFSGDMPDSIGELTQLTYLFMASTNFQPGTIPNSYQRLTNLRDMSLKDSKRTGEIPTWLKELDRVTLLDLDNNRFTGTIPTEIGNMIDLTFLFLHHNQLVGEVPTELGYATPLSVILLNDNKDLKGDMSSLCQKLDNGYSFLVRADCGGEKNQTKLECSCCYCCDAKNQTDCNFGEELAQYDPTWQSLYKRDSYNFTDPKWK